MPTLVLCGELDPSTSSILDAAVDALLPDPPELPDPAEARPKQLVVDLAGLTFMDSSGLRALIRAHELLGDQRLQVRGASPFIRKLLTITALDEQFDIEPEA